MITRITFLCLGILVFHSFLFAQVTVTVDVTAETHPIPPYLYGRNNSLSDDPSSPLTAAQWQKLKDAGVTFFRESGGNNSTKYNWRKKLTSHPDWYNNVYAHDWDYAAKSLQQNIPGAQGMWSFQLIGKAARTSAANFNDWGYNQSKWWEGVNQNLAGGGVLKPAGTKAQVEGNPDLYLEDWPADSTVKILDHWFGSGLDKSKVRYWNMDNETEIWSSTHDDVMPAQIAAEAFLQRYFEVARKARARFPEIKLVGPVTANEWQWYNWANSPVSADGTKYPWLKFFIKRVAEEQKATGIRLLDVLDIHFYPSGTTVSNVVQYHRVFFDKDYVFPEANGVKNVSGSWDNNETKEYILQRCREWLEQYMGTSHGVTFGITETGIPEINPGATAVWYASTLGEFMKQGDVELFSPWTWYPGMWEVLHLFSRYNKSLFVKAVSSEEEFVSAYPSMNVAGDSLTLVLVNRAASAKNVVINLKGFTPANPSMDVLRLANLPATETFVSHQVNALQKSSVTKNANSITASLPAMSVSSILMKGVKGEAVTSVEKRPGPASLVDVFPNPVSDASVKIIIRSAGYARAELLDGDAGEIREIFEGVIESAPFETELSWQDIPRGVYFIRVQSGDKITVRKLIH